MKNYKKYYGFIAGALYGLLFRLLAELNILYFEVFSITFLLIVSSVIALISNYFILEHIKYSKLKAFYYPILTILLFYIFCFITNLEDAICILILSIPQLLIVGVTGLLINQYVMQKKKVLPVMFVPFLFAPLEDLIPDTHTTYLVEEKIVIANKPEHIYPNLLDVPLITDKEYTSGIFQTLGIPRPVQSIVEKNEEDYFRKGYFTEGMILYESITDYKTNAFVDFSIDIAKSTLRNKPTDQHVLNSNQFTFDRISYYIVPLDDNTSEVRLQCEYSIASKVNVYANFWAETIIRDFEIRLLDVLKKKLDK